MRPTGLLSRVAAYHAPGGPRTGPRPCSVDTRDRVKQPSGLAGEQICTTWRDRHPGEASNQRRAARPNTGPILAVTRSVTLLRPARGPPHSRWVMRHLEQIG